MQTVTIGTTPIVLFNANPKRRRWTVQMIATGIIAGNTGKIYIGRGFTPNAVDGDPNAGDILLQASAIEEKKNYENDVLPFKGMIFAVASAAGQVVTIDEQTDIDYAQGIEANPPKV